MRRDSGFLLLHFLARLGRFAREFTDGLRTEDVRRLFERDAAQAYAVLARDRAPGEEPEKGPKRWLHRAWVLFRGISFKLSPPRRLLFVFSLLAGLLALLALLHRRGPDGASTDLPRQRR